MRASPAARSPSASSTSRRAPSWSPPSSRSAEIVDGLAAWRPGTSSGAERWRSASRPWSRRARCSSATCARRSPGCGGSRRNPRGVAGVARACDAPRPRHARRPRVARRGLGQGDRRADRLRQRRLQEDHRPRGASGLHERRLRDARTAAGGPFFTVKAAMRHAGDDAGGWTVEYLRAANLIRATTDYSKHVWTRPAGVTAQALRRAARGLQPYPAEKLGPVREPSPVAVEDPPARAAASGVGRRLLAARPGRRRRRRRGRAGGRRPAGAPAPPASWLRPGRTSVAGGLRSGLPARWIGWSANRMPAFRTPDKETLMGVLDDKVAIVTGCARGIGRATAELLAARREGRHQRPRRRRRAGDRRRRSRARPPSSAAT